jgi:hypothetical protein
MARVALAISILLSVGAGRPAGAAIDLTGPWFVEVKVDIGGTPHPDLIAPCHWEVMQSGTTLTVGSSCIVAGGPSTSTLVGTIEPATGEFTVTDRNAPCLASGGLTFRGTAVSDGLSFAGVVDCPPLPSSAFTGGLCQNGVLDGAEGCDVGFDQPGDCCDSTCQLRPAGTVCGGDDGDGDACTGFTCDAAGACLGPGNFPAGTPCGAVHDGCAFPACDGAGGCSTVATLADGDGCFGPCVTAQGLCRGGVCSAPPRAAGTRCEVDGNPCTLEACDGAGECQADMPRPAGERCSLDYDPCTLDACDGAGTCRASGCSACCAAAGGTCVPARDPSCEHADTPRASLVLQTRPGRARFAWRWQSDSEADFGDPARDAATVCAYHGSNPTLLLVADARAGTCGGRPCWTASPSGTRYRDSEGLPNGLRNITLRSGRGPTRASVAVRGSSVNFLFDGYPYQVYTPVHVQLKIADRCWESTFATVTARQREGFLSYPRYLGVGGSPSDAFVDAFVDGEAAVVP